MKYTTNYLDDLDNLKTILIGLYRITNKVIDDYESETNLTDDQVTELRKLKKFNNKLFKAGLNDEK